MCLSKGVVVDIVCWSNLQTACSELYVHIAVFDHRDHAVHQRHDNLMAAQPLVLRVLGVDAHGGVAHDGLRTCCGYHSIEASVSILVQHLALAACRHNGVGVGISHIVAQVEQVALLVAVDHLLCREHGLCLRVPVDHTQATVDKALLVEVYKHLEHAL